MSEENQNQKLRLKKRNEAINYFTEETKQN